MEFKTIFLKNGYSLKFIDTCFTKFFNKIFVKKILVDTVPKRDYLIVLPYLGPLSDKIQKRIRNLFKMYIPAGNINLVWKTQRRISNFLKFKDVIASDYESHIIYEFKCPGCIAGYVGETSTYFIVRGSQHLGISEFTGRPTTAGVPTNVTKHIKDKKCKCSLNNFRIIDRAVSYTHLTLPTIYSV